MGFKTFGFGGGRADVWEPEEDSTGAPRAPGSATSAIQRRAPAREPSRRRADGPDLRQSGRARTARRIPSLRPRTSARPSPHGDERRGNRRADRRRPYLRQNPRRWRCVAGRPGAGSCRLEEQGLGWKSRFGTGKGDDAISSGLEVIWTTTPTKWSNNFFGNLFGYEWELTKSPAGAYQWRPKYGTGASTVPDAHDPSKHHAPSMLTTDLALAARSCLRKDFKALLRKSGPVRGRVRPRLVQADASRHGPASRYLGPLVPKEALIWQDPVPAVDHPLVSEQDIAALKAKILASGLSISQLVSTAWASASTFRGSDKRGGANGARIRLAPQKDWEVNQPTRAQEGAGQARSDPEGVQRVAIGREKSLARRSDRARRLLPRSKKPRRTPGMTWRCPSRRDAQTRRRSRPMPPLSRRSNRVPTVSAIISAANISHTGRGVSGRSRRNC